MKTSLSLLLIGCGISCLGAPIAFGYGCIAVPQLNSPANLASMYLVFAIGCTLTGALLIASGTYIAVRAFTKPV
jgi:hypothetical protein